jgi:hypothetical protein
MNLSKWQKYGKAIVGLLYALYTFSVPLWSGDHHIDSGEWVIIITATATDVGIFIVPVVPQFKAVKSVLGVVLAVTAVLQTVIVGGVDANELALVVGAAIGALGITWAPAANTLGSTPVVVPTGLATG